MNAEARDPVCGMAVSPESAAGSLEHGGHTYRFCSLHCRDRFRGDPEAFAAGRRPAPAASPAGAGYTCPMHPEVVRDTFSDCPKCGMALEPREPASDEGLSPEYLDMRRRFRVGAALTLPLVALAMGAMAPGSPLHHVDMAILNWIQLALATPVVFWCGRPFFQRGWSSLLQRSPNMFTLILLGVGAAYGFSLAATLAPGWFPDGFRMAGGSVEPYFETAAVVTVLILLGQMLELRARHRTGGAIRRLLGLAPKTGCVLRDDGREADIPIAGIRAGDRLRVRPGETIAVDGAVIEGRSAVDESLVSGEPIPVEKAPGSPVISGSLNGTGSLLIRAERVGADTLLAQIARLVGEAQRSRAPIERLANRVSRFFVPAVLAASVLTFSAWAAWGAEPRLAHGLVNAVAVLIIACPCALGLATPLAIMVGMGRGAESGVLFRDAEALETLRQADTLVVDKTGTLTEGRPALAEVEPAGAFEAGALLRLAASLERGSEHPLASALVKGAESRGLRLQPAQDFRAHPGQGASGTVEGRRVLLGTAAFLEEQGIDSAPLQARLDELRQAGRTVVLAAVEGRLAGLLSVTDPIRATTPEAIRRLKAEGLRLIMLTGDSRATAGAVARGLELDDVIADVLPHEKHAAIKRLQAEGRVVAMAGDGINDAPALAQAAIGIALGTGADIAMESAGVTLVQGDLRGIVRARRLSRATVSAIRQNLALAFLYNAVSIPVAAGLLYPCCGLLITPIWASVAMSLSSLSVAANALRLRRARL